MIDPHGLKYAKLDSVDKAQLQQFLNYIKDFFINNSTDETLYLWGDFKLQNGKMIFPHLERFGYACLDKEKVVGMVYFLRLPPQFGYGNKCVYPAGIVRTDYRRRGIGTKLYTLAESLIESLGIERIFMAPRCDIKTEKPYNDFSPIAFKFGEWNEVERYEIVSQPQALNIKPSIVWNKRKCLIIRFIKELK